MARFIWWSSVALVLNLAIWALVADVLLELDGQPTVTTFLRARWWAFWVPALLLEVGLVLLAVHLYWPAGDQ
jgi:hypothetical protein